MLTLPLRPFAMSWSIKDFNFCSSNLYLYANELILDGLVVARRNPRTLDSCLSAKVLVTSVFPDSNEHPGGSWCIRDSIVYFKNGKGNQYLLVRSDISIEPLSETKSDNSSIKVSRYIGMTRLLLIRLSC